MRTFLTRLYALRLNAPVTLLMLLLQRTPVLQALFRADVRIPVFAGSLLRSALVVAASGGVVDTLTGATRFTTNPPTPASATVGAPFSLVFAVTGTPSIAESYKVTGSLPPGLTIPGMSSSGVLNATSGSMSGTPTQSGSYTTYVQAFSYLNLTGFTNYKSYAIVVNVSGGQPQAPTITRQPESLTLNVGNYGSFYVTASGFPTPTYQWKKDSSDIPGATSATLTFNKIQASDAGSYAVVASNSSGAVTSNTVTLTVNPAPEAPAITAQPQSLTVTAGENASFSITATGSPTPGYQWKKDGTDIPGATSATLLLTNVQAQDAAGYAVVASNSLGTATSNTATLTVNPLLSLPTISRQPQTLMLPTGYSGELTVVASATTSIQYQWMKDGSPVPGATSATLPIQAVQPGDLGSYTVVVSTSDGSVVSDPAEVLVGTNTGRLVNLSCRGEVGTGAKIMIPGMFLSGSSNKRLLIRAVGPTLGDPPYNVPNVLQDPILTIFNSAGVELTSNDNWGDNGAEAELTSLFQQVGAFALPSGSKDAAIAVDVAPNQGLTYEVAGKNGGTGIAIVEIYEIDQTGRISNMSTRGFVGVDAALLIPGVVSVGSKPKTLLIRAVGPTLGDQPYNVPGVLVDPVLRVMDSKGNQVLSNDDWNTAPNLAAVRIATQRVGAFSLDEGSKDAVILAVLQPGPYTFLVTGKNGGTGVALVEVYEVPDGP